MKPWRVIVEHEGKREVVYTAASQRRCVALAQTLPRVKGFRVLLQQEDSADQLHVTRTGKVIRDQPHLPPVGEHKIMSVVEAQWQTKK